tara:strand:- start:332 stop:574 length:243 start_codon:yes stop_codon:yes gene_type:complete
MRLWTYFGPVNPILISRFQTGWRLSVKVGDLVRFRHDGGLMLILNEQRADVFDGVIVSGANNGKTVTSYKSLMEKVSGDS